MSMTRYLQFDETTGRVLAAMRLSAKAYPLNQQVGFGLLAEPNEARTDATAYVDMTNPANPVAADRPLWNPFPTSGAAPLSVDATDAPSGTVLTVVTQGGTSVDVTDFAASIEFVDDGVYDITVTPPFPYQVVKQKVTVT